MINKAKCKVCGETIESTYRYDFVTCLCGEIFVDCGKDYWRWGATNMENFNRITEDKEEQKEK